MILGITGISGSGKHTAAEWFKSRGWEILDADKIAHKLYLPYSSLWKAITTEFGNDILNADDTINRKKLGDKVFCDNKPGKPCAALQKLNELTHPLIRHEIEDMLYRLKRKNANAVVVAALWKELDLPKNCDKLLHVKADPKLAAQRILKRDSITEDQYQMRVQIQSQPEKADFVIENSGTLGEFQAKLAALAL
jgi:dephospho-CoA kinase